MEERRHGLRHGHDHHTHPAWIHWNLPDELAVSSGTLYFEAYNITNGNELWKSDGTASGTVMVQDIRPDGPSSSPERLTDVGGTLFFRADDGVNGQELWKSDGTASGTVMVKNIRSGGSSSAPEWLTDVDGTLYFSANDGVNGEELWKSDGTAPGTVMAANLLSGGSSASPERLKAIHDAANQLTLLFFTAYDFSTGRELWMAILILS